MGDLLLGIDVGTYSSKGVLVEANGRILKSHVVKHSMSIPRPGWAEQDADVVWWADVVAICRALLDGQPYAGANVAAIATSAIGPCMVPLDRAGRPLRPAILYGVDTRASTEIELLNAQIGVDRIFEFSGMMLSNQAVGPKILWMRRNEPDLWRQVATVTTASSYLVYRLTGAHVIDRHTATHFIPLYDLHAQEWSDRYAGGIVALDMLPALKWSDELAGTVHAQAAAETGLREGTPVAVGAVDALSESVSIGIMDPGDMMLMYGSTAYLLLVHDSVTTHPAIWSLAGAFEGQHCLGAAMATTGTLTAWLRELFAGEAASEPSYAALFDMAKACPPGAEGLIVLPYFSGERTPINDPHARGIIAGLSLSHGRAHLFRAALEGIAYGIRHNIAKFYDAGAAIEEIVAVGGGTTGDTWLQIVSDVTGIRQLVPQNTIGASYGDAFLAGCVAGRVTPADLSGWVTIERVVEPNPAVRLLYDHLYERYLRLYDQTKPLIHDLAALQAGQTGD